MIGKQTVAKLLYVIPAEAGIQNKKAVFLDFWIPALAGMTDGWG